VSQPKPLRLAVAALTRNVYIGRIDKSGLNFLDRGKQDVTSDFLRAVIDRFEGPPSCIANSKGVFRVTVEKIGDQLCAKVDG
jgi:hypothetical protein